MTRIFGYFTESVENAHIPIGVSKLINNIQESVKITYEKGWQAYGLGFILISKRGVESFSVYKGYRGISPTTKIRSILPVDLNFALSNNPNAVFGVLQNEPDKGEFEFISDSNDSWTFPLESRNWFAITMGYWGQGEYSDTNLPWYNPERPSTSILRYLESKPTNIDFSWIDKKRIPFIIAVEKNSGRTIIEDKYSGNDPRGYIYERYDNNGIIIFNGVRHLGNQV